MPFHDGARARDVNHHILFKSLEYAKTKHARVRNIKIGHTESAAAVRERMGAPTRARDIDAPR
jgi:hypothetical protein